MNEHSRQIYDNPKVTYPPPLTHPPLRLEGLWHSRMPGALFCHLKMTACETSSSL